jgi:predicted ATPase/DNA-binding XRE family transcriptional regulator
MWRFNHQRLRELREHRGMTQQDLAAKLGCSSKTVSNYELGVVNKGGFNRVKCGPMVEDFAKFFGIPSGEFVVREDEPQAAQASTGEPWPQPPLADSVGLPRWSSSFVGREPEMKLLAERLRRGSLVTVTGAGGCGKTRLAVTVAERLRPEFEEGVWFVDLAAVHDSDTVPRVVAAALGCSDVGPSSPALEVARRIGGRRMLVLLDNCEHLVGAVASLVATLLKSCTQLVILATSREHLNLPDEVTHRVASLTVPEEDDSVQAAMSTAATRLFVDRVQAFNPEFDVTSDNASAIVEICRAVDGIPLAIELAAARARTMSLEGIASRLGDRLALLSCGCRHVAPRHATLRACIDWSFDLLQRDEQALLTRAAVFVGGFSLEAATEVCADGEALAGARIDDSPIELLLSALVERSLVVFYSQRGEGRYRLLETVRQYTITRLEEEERTRLEERHARFFLALVTSSEPQGRQGKVWLHRLLAERENLRAACRWWLRAPASALALLPAAFPLFGTCLVLGFHRDGWDVLAPLADVEAPEAQRFERAIAASGAGFMASHLGMWEEAARYGQLSVELGRGLADRGEYRWLLRQSALQCGFRGDLEGAQLALQLRQEASLPGDSGDWEAGFPRRVILADLLGRPIPQDGEDMEEVIAESLAYARTCGQRDRLARYLVHAGWHAIGQERWADAAGLLREAIAVCEELSYRQALLWAVYATAVLAEAVRGELGKEAAGLLAGWEVSWGRLEVRLPDEILREHARRVERLGAVRGGRGVEVRRVVEVLSGVGG